MDEREEADTRQMHVVAGDHELVEGSPYSVQVAAGRPIPARSTLLDLDRRPYQLGETLAFKVAVRDTFGNQ